MRRKVRNARWAKPDLNRDGTDKERIGDIRMAKRAPGLRAGSGIAVQRKQRIVNRGIRERRGKRWLQDIAAHRNKGKVLPPRAAQKAEGVHHKGHEEHKGRSNEPGALPRLCLLSKDTFHLCDKSGAEG